MARVGRRRAGRAGHSGCNGKSGMGLSCRGSDEWVLGSVLGDWEAQLL